MTQRKPPRRTKARSDGEGSVYPEGTGYRAEIMIGGTTHRRRATTKEGAQRKLLEIRSAHGLGLGVPNSGRVKDYLEWWLDLQADRVGTRPEDKSVNTLINYRWALAPIIKDHGHRQLYALEPEHVEMVLRAMARTGKSRESVKRVKFVLGQALDTLQARGKVSRNVARLAELPRTDPPPEQRSLTVDQATSLMEAAHGDPVEAFIITGLMLGLRPGELLGLQWENIDLDGATLGVVGSLKREPATREGETETLRLGDVKRGIRASRRRLDLPPQVVEALRAHRSRQREERLLAGPEWQEHGLVFPTAVGTPISPSGMNKRLAKVTERAGLGHWSMTELSRHSAASLMSDRGLRLEVIADVLGHSSTRMLEMHYRHQVRPSIDGHVAVMNDLFGQGAG